MFHDDGQHVVRLEEINIDTLAHRDTTYMYKSAVAVNSIRRAAIQNISTSIHTSSGWYSSIDPILNETTKIDRV